MIQIHLDLIYVPIWRINPKLQENRSLMLYIILCLLASQYIHVQIDKASVLREAISYVKQLQERITVLEQEREKENTKSMICIKKSHPCSKSCETISNGRRRSNQVLPDVEAIGLELEKEVLLKIHCEKRRGILLKLLGLLGNIHVSIASSSVLPFGKNTLHITIIAQVN